YANAVSLNSKRGLRTGRARVSVSAAAINVEGRGLPALAGSGMPATASLSEPVLQLVVNCCSSSIEAVVRGSAAHRLVFAQGPGRGLQALRWALPSGVSRALPEKLLLKHGVSACQKPPALAGGVVTVFLAWVPTHHRPLTTGRLTLTLGPAQAGPRATCSPTPS